MDKFYKRIPSQTRGGEIRVADSIFEVSRNRNKWPGNADRCNIFRTKCRMSPRYTFQSPSARSLRLPHASPASLLTLIKFVVYPAIAHRSDPTKDPGRMQNAENTCHPKNVMPWQRNMCM